MTLFRSELMSKCQLYLLPEAAYNCVAELGELGKIVNIQYYILVDSKVCEISFFLLQKLNGLETNKKHYHGQGIYIL